MSPTVRPGSALNRAKADIRGRQGPTNDASYSSRTKRIVGCLLFILFSFVSGPHLCQAMDLTQASTPQSLSVVLDDNYPPYSFRDPNGKLQGSLVELWGLWEKRTGVQVHLIATDWIKAQKLMESGQADVIDTIFFTKERAKIYEFSEPYASIDVAIFFHKTISGITGPDTLRGFTVGVKDGDACVEWLENHDIHQFRKYPSYEALVDAAVDGEVRVYCIDKPPAFYLLSKRNIESEFRYSPTLYSGEFHWATSKLKNKTFELVHNGFSRISEADRLAITEKWEGRDPADAFPVQHIQKLTNALIGVASLALLLVLWNRVLHRRVSAKTTDLVQALSALELTQRHYKELVITAPVGVFETEADGKCLFVNERWLEMTGLTLSQALDVDWSLAVHPDDRERVLKEWRKIDADSLFREEFRFQRPDGAVLWVLAQAKARYTPAGKLDGYIGGVTDISERKDAEARVEFLAQYDALTKLPNRLLGKDRMERAMVRAGSTATKAALLFLDLDHFKTINDSLGHNIGDSLLLQVSQRLQECIRETDTISRQGGDEFLIVLPDIDDLDIIANIAVKILERLSPPFLMGPHELTTSLSIGISIYPDDGDDFDTLLKKADMAMYHAKEAGRNTYRFFADRMNENADEYVLLRTGLQKALDQNEMVLHYQPQIHLPSQQVIGVEALIRWNHPQLGLVQPGRFIPVAEESGLIVPIGEWVLQQACRQAREWQLAGLPKLVVAVNLSAVQFKRDNLMKSVSDALMAADLDPTCLELELTESILIKDTDNVLLTVKKLKALGVKLSIDDFGTGYSSLSYLKRFEVDKVKIDQSFVRDITSDPNDAAIVRAILQMSHSLGLTTIAEGVEDSETLEILQGYDCDEVQGYFYSRPLPADQMAKFLAEWQARTAELKL